MRRSRKQVKGYWDTGQRRGPGIDDTLVRWGPTLRVSIYWSVCFLAEEEV